MGLLFTKTSELLDPMKNHKILMIGLDGAGKTTLLYKLKADQIVTTIPTIGFSAESIQYKNINFIIWLVDSIKSEVYYENFSAIFFIVDATDHERLPEVQDIIRNLTIEQSLLNLDILIFLNKQDQPNAMTPAYLTYQLKLNNIKDRKWFVQPTVNFQVKVYMKV